MKTFRPKHVIGEQGVTLVELLVYIAIVGIVMGAIYTTFQRQQDSYMVQERLAILQQNLRGAMYLVASDLQMAGYYTSYDPLAFPFGIDWDGDTANETIRPLLFGGNLNPDNIVIIKANGVEIRALQTGAPDEGAAEGGNQITLNDLDLDGDGNNDFDITNKPYGVIIKSDLTRAEFFRVNLVGANLTVTPAAGTFNEPYFPGPTADESDLIARVDVIVYSVDVNNNLLRQNLGDGTGSQIVAENISDLQLQYAVVDDVAPGGEDWVDTSSGPAGVKADNKAWDERDIRRIQMTITGSVQVSPTLGTKTRNLTSTIKVRNMGMDTL